MKLTLNVTIICSERIITRTYLISVHCCNAFGVGHESRCDLIESHFFSFSPSTERRRRPRPRRQVHEMLNV